MAVRDTASLLVGLVVLLYTWGAWAAVAVNMTDKVEVYLGQEAQITCSYSSDDGSGALTFEWFYEMAAKSRKSLFRADSLRDEVIKGTRFTDRISGNLTNGQMTLTISKVQLEDEADFICSIKSLTEGSGEGRTKLKVFVKPQPPTIKGEQNGISVTERSPSKIGSCEVKNGYPRPNITWYKDSMPLRNIPGEVEIESRITTGSSNLFTVNSELLKTMVEEERNALFYCEVTYFVPGGTRMSETSRINVTVFYPSTAVKIWVESPKGKIKEGDTIELHCSSNGNSISSPFAIKHENSFWDTATASVPNVSRTNSGLYECTYTDMETETLETLSNSIEVFVNYLDPPVVEPESVTVVNKGHELNATCNALSSLPTQTAWFKNGQEVSKGHTLMLSDATFDTAGSYDCVVTVPEMEGMTVSSELFVHVQGPPEITGPSTTHIETNEKTLDLVCDVRGYPAPSIKWTISSDGRVLNSTIQEEPGNRFKSRAKVAFTYDVIASCNASNEHGTEKIEFDIQTITTNTTPAITTISNATVTNTTTPAITTISNATVKAGGADQSGKAKGSNGVIIAVIIFCILLLAILGSVLYFLYKKGRICGRSGKQDLTKEKSRDDNIVVEMRSDNTEEAILLGVNGEKQPPSDQ